MSNKPTETVSNSVIKSCDYAPGLEASIVEVLQACFSSNWGTVDYWLWKHAHRPGFDRRQIRIFLEDGRPAACFHSGIFPIRLAPGLDVPCSLEGDYAVLPQLRGCGLLERAYDEMGERLAADGVVLRIGFTSAQLQQHVYQKKFGHTFVPTITGQYRKVLSTRLLCEKLQRYGEKLQGSGFFRRVVRRGELRIELRVTGFEPCCLTLTSQGASCTTELGQQAPDLRVAIPYQLLALRRNGMAAACRSTLGCLLRGQIRISRLLRFTQRMLAS